MAAPWSGGAQLRIIGRINGQITVNVLNFATNTVGFDDPAAVRTLLLALATAMLDCIRTVLLPALPVAWRLERVTAKAIYPEISDEVEVPGEGPDVGGGTATDVTFASQLINVRTGFGGRTKRGRVKLPPPPEGGVENSELTNIQLDLLVAFAVCVAGKFIGSGASTAWRLGVYSRKTRLAVGGSFDAAFTEATELVPQRLVAIQSSRKIGRGA